MVGEKLKNIIYKQLNKELGHVELIPFKGSIFFFDRENKYWYFEYENNGTLWWRFSFFESFFTIFSLEKEEYTKILGEWVEEVLNCKVNTTIIGGQGHNSVVEEVLNCKVNTTKKLHPTIIPEMEEMLNCEVFTTQILERLHPRLMEEVLNCTVNTTKYGE